VSVPEDASTRSGSAAERDAPDARGAEVLGIAIPAIDRSGTVGWTLRQPEAPTSPKPDEMRLAAIRHRAHRRHVAPICERATDSVSSTF
jgi:hypothetical protein